MQLKRVHTNEVMLDSLDYLYPDLRTFLSSRFSPLVISPDLVSLPEVSSNLLKESFTAYTIIYSAVSVFSLGDPIDKVTKT